VAGTVLVKDIRPGSASSLLDNLTNVEARSFFVADFGSNGVALWKSDGTAAGTVLVEPIASAPLGQFVRPYRLLVGETWLGGSKFPGPRRNRRPPGTPFYFGRSLIVRLADRRL
jgi:ELWxxDGT repeat protein